MNAHSPIAERDPRDLALTMAPGHLKGLAATLVFVLAELRRGGDPVELVDRAADVLRHRLGPNERGLLLMAAAQAAEPEHLEELSAAVVDRTGPPVPALDSIRLEAHLWAAEASPAERRACLAAIWLRTPKRVRAAFLREAPQ